MFCLCCSIDISLYWGLHCVRNYLMVLVYDKIVSKGSGNYEIIKLLFDVTRSHFTMQHSSARALTTYGIAKLAFETSFIILRGGR